MLLGEGATSIGVHQNVDSGAGIYELPAGQSRDIFRFKTLSLTFYIIDPAATARVML
ncbi:hypothetical protein BT96DRAFT_922941 [Gymnopus androsaceus JB14]|uniref:Uncharacterized protein n=1 Tax=Gymnopus androsaceus JB14 TaxID=1447944 RepID=A0A6A4HC23_9AGAR|nr:hypothetical protein BT96DRAFT_922941 [Gymnopus androsaceus JB14]